MPWVIDNYTHKKHFNEVLKTIEAKDVYAGINRLTLEGNSIVCEMEPESFFDAFRDEDRGEEEQDDGTFFTWFAVKVKTGNNNKGEPQYDFYEFSTTYEKGPC